MRLIANCMVKNDAAWVWYAINSTLEFVDQLLIYDTGSTDATVEIIKSIDSPKITFIQYPASTSKELSSIRQHMLEASHGDWLFILDGDEIWPSHAFINTLKCLSNSYDFLIHSYFNLLGDVYHYQEDAAGRYHIGSYTGHLTTRFINLQTIPGLHYSLEYPLESFCDSSGTAIQNRKPFKTLFMPDKYLHATHLRSRDLQISNRNNFKYELGNTFPKNFNYPKSFYVPRPVLVKSPWTPRDLSYTINAAWQSPLRYYKRRLIDHS